ncbi:MAG TPA: hypothetical protein VMS71_07420 [Candidatus Acidoferrum sp.]|nr:hypothetical protein [Candidatus Acidoferrum sp.]
MHRIWVAVIILASLGGEASAIRAASLSYKFGVGYDFLSQQYFLDSAAQAGADSILANWSLKTDYLNDPKGILQVKYCPSSDRRLDLRGLLEQTESQFRLKLDGSTVQHWGDVRFDWNNQMDWRDRFKGSSEPGDSYLAGSSRARIRKPLSDTYFLWSQVAADFVHFSTPSFYAFDNERLGFKFGLERFQELSLTNFDLFFLGRRVPDSSLMSYASGGAEASYFGTFDWGQVDFGGRFERKNYGRPDHQDDYSRVELDTRDKVSIAGPYYTRPEIEFEGTWFDANDPVNLNYTRTRLALLLGRDMKDWSVAIGPAGELLTEALDTLTQGENYFESGGRFELDYVDAGRVFASLEWNAGYRKLKFENDQQSSFSYQRLSLLGDWTFWKSFEFNILLSGDWEWHTRSSDNNRLYLLSTSLLYSF